jgi:ABC-type multidrug transport system fused ATPase/permease subunit
VFTGKSTVIKLITRMLDVASGDILLDGANIANVTKESIRRRVAVVPQDTCLFDETVGYNIKYGNPEATDEEVREVVLLANLQDTVRKLPQVRVFVFCICHFQAQGGKTVMHTFGIVCLMLYPAYLLIAECSPLLISLADFLTTRRGWTRWWASAAAGCPGARGRRSPSPGTHLVFLLGIAFAQLTQTHGI